MNDTLFLKPFLPCCADTFLCWASYGLVLAPLSRDEAGSTDLDLRRLALFEADKLKGLTTVALVAAAAPPD